MGPNPQETADLVTFTEGILNGKLHFLCSVSFTNQSQYFYFYIFIDTTPKVHSITTFF